MNSFERRLQHYRARIEEELDALTPPCVTQQQPVIEAMRYSLLGGGKRIRAILTLEVCRALGGSIEEALPVACAIEMVHAYSLIHDDLPCMDDDDLRRGKLTSHKQFGEAMAVLAGDGLLTLAFETLSDERTIAKLGAEKALACVQVLGKCAGEYGMLGGQVIDVLFEGEPVTTEQHMYMVSLKTGALIRAAAQCGAIVAGASADRIATAISFAEQVGAAFQMTDDLLDVTGNTQTLGKPVHSDDKHTKNTFIRLYGIEETKRLIDAYHTRAASLAKELTDDCKLLRYIASILSNRSY